MGFNKKYYGYQSFDYLEKGKDYKEFKLIEGENARSIEIWQYEQSKERRE